MLASLRQKVAFLHCWGLPPAWIHSLEYSEMVLQRTESVLSLELHISAIQASLKDSTSRRFWQLLNGAAEKTWSQNCWKNKIRKSVNLLENPVWSNKIHVNRLFILALRVQRQCELQVGVWGSLVSRAWCAGEELCDVCQLWWTCSHTLKVRYPEH